MTRPRRTLALSAAAALAAAMLGSTGPDVAVASTAAEDPPTPTIPARYLNQEIDWSVCSFDAIVKSIDPDAPTTYCATIKAPMDWNDPDAHRPIDLAIAYSQATGTSQGLMMTNPGGPGGAGLTLSVALALDKPELFSDYDLVGFDPRGFGASEPLHCLTSPQRLANLPRTPDYRARTVRTHRTEVAEAKLLADACSRLPFSEFVSSQQTVYDMELIRALLHSRLLNFIGYSYGTWLGSWYADTYPRRVGRFVLDSNMDWTHTQLTNVYFDPFSGQRRRDTQLFPWMARHSDQIRGLGSTRLRVAAKYRQIRSSLVALVRSGDETIRGEDLDFRVYGDIYGDTRFVTAALDILVSDEYAKNPTGGVTSQQLDAAWARLAPALRAYTSLEDLYDSWGVTPAGKATRTGAVNVSRMDVIRDALVRARHDTTPDAVVDLGAFGDVVRCNDTPWVHGASYYLNLSDQMQDKYPWIGYENGVPFCAFWPYAPQDRQVNLAGSPRILQIQSELDPATAYEGSLRSHRLTKKVTRFVAIDDEGQHGQYVAGPSSCVERIGDRFVFTGELPGRDLVCGTTPLPADQSVYPVNGPVDGNSEPLPARKTGAAPNRMLQRILDRVATHALI